jgi:ATP-binding cassette subfamily C protein
MTQTLSRSDELSKSLLKTAISASRRGFLAIGVFTAVINILMLTGSFFMLQVYDRVIPSRSLPTLAGLVVLVIILYAFQGVLDAIRGRLLVRIGGVLGDQLSAGVYDAIVQLPLSSQSHGDGLQPVRDIDQIRGFLSGLGPTALFDLPWMPLYLGLCFAFHFWIGIAALIGALLLIAVTLLTDALTRSPVKASSGFASARMSLLEASRRNAEVLRSMGMKGRLFARWSKSNQQYLDTQREAADAAGGLGAASRVMRMMLQSAVLAVGAYLVINQQATAGVIIASSILTSRSLAPIELAIANWKGLLSALQSWKRLSELLNRLTPAAPPMVLPAPKKQLSVEGVSITPAGLQKLVVNNVSFRLEAGQALGIIGPSASGKSSLARAIVGVWQTARGKVRFDGAAIQQWDAEMLGQYIGYLPQDVELFDGSVAENIARFDPDAQSPAIIEAAQAAGIHEMIVQFPDGYQTIIGESGAALSAGQRQRVALARALFGSPFLVVLDEPNSNLDAEGDRALAQAVAGIRSRGGIVIIVAHRPAALAGVDLILAMSNGEMQAYGPKDEVLKKVLEPNRIAPVRPSSSGTLAKA